MNRSQNSACLQKRKTTSWPEQHTRLPFPKALIGLHAPASRSQVLKWKPSKVPKRFLEVAVHRLGLPSLSAGEDTSILFYHEGKFIEFVFDHAHDTSTSLFQCM